MHTVRFLVLFSISLIPVTSFATDYFVAPNGNDQNPGSVDRPWQTLDKANSTVRAGDTVNLRQGKHIGVIQPANSGSKGSPIVYRNFNREAATVSAPNGSASAISLTRDHIRVEGLVVEVSNPPTGRTFNVVVKGNHNVIRGLSMTGSSDLVSDHNRGIEEGGLIIEGGDYNLVEGNLIQKFSFQGLKLKDIPRFNRIRNNRIQDNWGDPIRIDSSKGVIQANLIENNYLAGSRAANGIQFNGDYSLADQQGDTSNRGVVIRNNEIVGNAEMCIALKGTSDIVIEGNVCTGHQSDNDGFTDGVHQRNSSPAIHKGGSKFGSKNIIIRRNVVYDNQSGVNGYENWKIYNNTIVGNNRDYEGPNSQFNPQGEPFFVGIRPAGGHKLGIKNNIICDHNSAEVRLHTDSRGEIDGNLYCDRSADSNLALVDAATRDWSSHSLTSWQAVLRDLSQMEGRDRNSISADPAFENAPNRPVGSSDRFKFTLRASSPAIDAGVPLTYAQASGSGRELIVKDARYFSDGYGIVEGDQIRVANEPPVRITSINYAENRITLARNITWSAGAPVNLNYVGAGPDIGAYEFSAFDAPTPPTLAASP